MIAILIIYFIILGVLVQYEAARSNQRNVKSIIQSSFIWLGWPIYFIAFVIMSPLLLLFYLISLVWKPKVMFFNNV